MRTNWNKKSFSIKNKPLKSISIWVSKDPAKIYAIIINQKKLRRLPYSRMLLHLTLLYFRLKCKLKEPAETILPPLLMVILSILLSHWYYHSKQMSTKARLLMISVDASWNTNIIYGIQISHRLIHWYLKTWLWKTLLTKIRQ